MDLRFFFFYSVILKEFVWMIEFNKNTIYTWRKIFYKVKIHIKQYCVYFYLKNIHMLEELSEKIVRYNAIYNIFMIYKLKETNYE